MLTEGTIHYYQIIFISREKTEVLNSPSEINGSKYDMTNRFSFVSRGKEGGRKSRAAACSGSGR